MKLDILNREGGKTGKSVNLPDAVFGIEPNDHAIYLAVKLYNNNQRQGTASTKEKGEVSFSTRKIKKQKGTGTARAGSKKSPLFKGGGNIFGPKPRDYGFKLNKKVKELARNSALTYKAKEKNLSVLENFDLDAPKTKDFVDLLSTTGNAEKKILLVTAPGNQNLYLSSRNLPKAKVVSVDSLNVYDIMNAETLIIQEGAVANFGTDK